MPWYKYIIIVDGGTFTVFTFAAIVGIHVGGFAIGNEIGKSIAHYQNNNR